jgi:hypothetical protein
VSQEHDHLADLPYLMVVLGYEHAPKVTTIAKTAADRERLAWWLLGDDADPRVRDALVALLDAAGLIHEDNP